jgi:ABC-type Fe3+ transport system permease subunit
LRELLLPAAWPALQAATVLVFVLALANFAIPAIFQVKVFTAEVWLRFSTRFDHLGALVASLPVVVVPALAWPGCAAERCPGRARQSRPTRP